MTEVVVALHKKERVDLNWLYKKFRGVCWICRKFCPRDQASRDHVLPKSLGGGYEKTNMALAHKDCNTKRGNGYKEIFFKHFNSLDEVKFIEILDDHDLLVQLTTDKNGGFNLIVSRKKDETYGRRRARNG